MKIKKGGFQFFIIFFFVITKSTKGKSCIWLNKKHIGMRGGALGGSWETPTPFKWYM